MKKQYAEYDDEINLYDLWKVIAKRKMLIMGLFIIAVGLTAISSFMMPNIYRGEAVLLVNLKSEVTNAKELIDSIVSIDREKIFRIMPKNYSNVMHIKLVAFRNSDDKIAVTINAKKIDDIRSALLEVVRYLNNMEMIKSAVTRDKEILLMKSAELSNLIKSSPDLLATYHRLFVAGKLSTIGFNPIEVSNKIIELKTDLLKTNQDILRLNKGGIEIAAQPYISDKPVSPKIHYQPFYRDFSGHIY